jgi:hypothetical protein
VRGDPSTTPGHRRRENDQPRQPTGAVGSVPSASEVPSGAARTVVVVTADSLEARTTGSEPQVRRAKGPGMNVEERIEDALGHAQSPSRSFGQTIPFAMEAGSSEARLLALENDVGKLRKALKVAAAEIERLAAKIDGE